MNLCDKILKIRKDNKMSQENLAEVLNVTRQTVSNWENSKNYPDIETLILISDKFNISLDILLKGDNLMVKDIDKKIKSNKKLRIIIIALILGIILFFIGNFTYRKVIYYVNNNHDIGTSSIVKCYLDEERIKVMVKYFAYNKDSKKWYEHLVYDDTKVKPYSFEIVNDVTGEEKTELEKQMNINLCDFDTAADLRIYMIDYIENIGEICIY